MPLQFRKPILYLITRGASTETTTRNSPEFQAILAQISAAVSAGIDLVQIREKNMTARALFQLTEQTVKLARGTATRLLVNDRADIAAAACADGVHLATQSIEPKIIRETFGQEFLIGCSTHSLTEATSARDGGADFAVLGPVFATDSKANYGSPLGLDAFSEICHELKPFTILALGGISNANAIDCLNVGASGIAGISLFRDPNGLSRVSNQFQRMPELGDKV